MYWDSTGDWRLTYYSDLAKKDVNALSVIEKSELELDILEKRRTETILNNLHKDSSFLDVGCGVGRQILELAKKWTNIQFMGIDISHYQIGLLNKMIKEHNIDNVTGMVLDAGDVEKIGEKFDIISFYNNSFGCLKIEQQMNFLEKIDSVLNPNGVLIIGCFDCLDLVEQAYEAWGFSKIVFDISTGIVDLGEYQSSWKTNDVFIPYFNKHPTIYLEDSEKSGLGTVYVFKNSIGGDEHENL